MIRISDARFIEGFCKHPDIWPHIADDDCGAKADWKPPLAPHIHWLVSEDCGALFMCYPLQPRLWEAHGQVLPKFRENTKKYYAQVKEYLRDHTICTRLLGLIPAGNYPAKAAARAAGMRAGQVLRGCYMKNGRLKDMTIFEIEIAR